MPPGLVELALELLLPGPMVAEARHDVRAGVRAGPLVEAGEVRPGALQLDRRPQGLARARPVTGSGWLNAWASQRSIRPASSFPR